MASNQEISALGRTILRAYSQLLSWSGLAGAIAALAWAPPSRAGWVAVALGTMMVIGARVFAVQLSKFSYLTMNVVPVGVVLFLGEPAGAVAAGFLGTFLGDWARGKGREASFINAGREGLAALAAAGVYVGMAALGGLPQPADLTFDPPVFTPEALPVVGAFFVAFFFFGRSLFYFSLAYRGKLTYAEWTILLRYELVTVFLGTVATLTAVASLDLVGAPAFDALGRMSAFSASIEDVQPVVALVAIAALLGTAGELARRLMVEAILSEELRKVVAMEAVIAAGMGLDESLAQIEQLAGRLVDWTWLRIYAVDEESERLLPIYPAQVREDVLEGADELLAAASSRSEAVVITEGLGDSRLPADSPVRSLVLQPLNYGKASLGLLQVAHHRPGTYGTNEVRLIERFGRQVALAVQLDSLFRPMTDSASEMQTQLRALGSRVSELRSNGQQVAEHAAGMRERIDDQGHRTAVGAGEAEQLTAEADEMATDARSAAERAVETGQLAAANRGAIAEAIGRLVELRDFVDTEARQLSGLADASTQIFSLVSSVRDLADQTNLLALNAAIEAHRAGEHGLGFAVVADEVRKLADSSGQAAEAARVVVEGVRQQVDAALGRMRAGAMRVSGVGELSQTALSSVDRIVSAASNTAELTTRMADRAEEQRERLTVLLEQIKAVAGLAEQNRDGTREVAVAAQAQAQTLEDMERAATALGEVSERLTQYIERFTEASI